MYLFGLLLGNEPRLVTRRCRERADGEADDEEGGKGGYGASTQFAEESAGDTGSMLTAETPIEKVPVMHVTPGRRERRRSRSQVPHRDRLSLWSRLMCQPEVFDPHVEASPMSFLLEVDRRVAASPLAEKTPRHRRHSRAATAAAAALSTSAATHVAIAAENDEEEDDGERHVVSSDSSSPISADDDGDAEVAAPATAAGAVVADESVSMTVSSPTKVSDSDESTSSGSTSQDPSSPISSIEEFTVEVEEEEEEEEGQLDDRPLAFSVSMTNANASKPRRAFRVTDTRRSRCRLPHRAAHSSDSTLTANSSFDTLCMLDGGSSSGGAGTHSQSGRTTATFTTAVEATIAAQGPAMCAVGRLISRQELAVRKSQRRQQNKEAARRKREHRAAWAELVATQECGVRQHRHAAMLGAATDSMGVSLVSERGSEAALRRGVCAEPAVVAVPLTNEALDAHREHVQAPTYELPADFLARIGTIQTPTITTTTTAATSATATAPPTNGVVGAGVETKEAEAREQYDHNDESVDTAARDGDGSVSGDSCRSGDDAFPARIEGESMNGVESALPELYVSLLRRSEAATPSTVSEKAAAAAASKVRRAGSQGRNTSSSSVDSRVLKMGSGVQRIPRGRYALGSRGYIEHVMFADRRQQECALFTLLTEAHRQARTAHLRLSQVYYYYILPILAQYQSPRDVEGLVTSLQQCGSGTLRMFHKDFCKQVSVNSAYDPSQGCHVPVQLVQVHPVDYQFAQYRFENPWRELFHEIKAFLGMQAREDVSVATPSSSQSINEEGESDAAGQEKGGGRQGKPTQPGKGTVCMAATVLHSMELFERQRHTQMAIRDAEEWLAWYYYYVAPQLQAATTVEMRSAMLQSLLPASENNAPMPAEQEADVAPGDEQTVTERQRSSARAAGSAHPLEREYLPMVWGRACETAQREQVLGYRRQLKLDAMAKAQALLTPCFLVTSNTHDTTDDALTSAVCSPTVAKPLLSDALEGTADVSLTSTAATQGHSYSAATAGSDDAIADSSVVTAWEADVAFSVLPCLFATETEPAHAVVVTGGSRSTRTSPTTPNAGVYTGRLRNGFVVASFEDDDEDEEEEHVVIDSYNTVNVGCFGLSFFSFFD